MNESVFAALMSGTVSPLSWPWLEQLGASHDEEKYTLGNMILEDGTNVNHELVKDGSCIGSMHRDAWA